MIRFIEDHRADHGVEPICPVLPIAPATFYDHLAKRAAPPRLSDRAKRDEDLKLEIERVFEESLSVYGVRKVWHQMRREGLDIARCTVARLMKDLGLEGVEAVEYANLEWVDWFNNRRLLEPIGNIPPAEAEANFYAALERSDMAA
ncbi:hypothetical protein AN189_15925 [Loktanella sp. 3ANDIMAR09]|nr:hypothetical protein AN189_15925 [Loktanella sp. 3ANDIMAR09]